VNGTSLLRFSAGERIFHWVYFLSFVVLAVTGAFVYVPWLAFAVGEAGETSRLLHRLFALAFLASPLLPLVISPRRYLRNLGEAFSWRAEDVRGLWFILTRYYWTGNRQGLPPQGKFTAGQKLHVVMQFMASAVIGATGLILWFGPPYLSVVWLRWSVLLHSLSAVVALCFVLVHLYMVVVHPLTNEAIAAMTLGTVSEDYARTHHPRWHAALERRRAERP
jgi:formate dehydrogenase subunit gamma